MLAGKDLMLMAETDPTPLMVLTADQRDSRRGTDLVPAAERALHDLPWLRPLERTAGDEFQAVVGDPTVLVEAVERLIRLGGWNIGIGIGAVEQPLPSSTRAGRGPAFVLAREAVTSAKATPSHLRVVGSGEAVRWLETVLWLWVLILNRRTRGGWEVADLLQRDQTQEQVASALQISRSAVSQRAQAAGVTEARRARELAVHLTQQLLETSR